EAVSRLLEALPNNPGLTLLVALHLQPHTDSQMPEILSKVTTLNVQEATHGTALEPNRVYIIPPNATMKMVDGSIVLNTRPPRGVHMPIDHLFRSLAEAQGSGAVGVTLPGDGPEGTLGFQAIRAEGGTTFAQEEKPARHDSMPRSAIGDGCVDYVLSPARIAQEL